MKRLIQRRIREVLAAMICAGVVGACESGQPYTPRDGAPDTRASAKSDGAAGTGDAPIETTDAPFDRGDALTDEGDALIDHADAPFDQTDAPRSDAPADTIDAPADASSDARGDGGSDGALDARCHDDVCLAQGAQCSNSIQCGSGACVEGVCCESACASKCYSCVHLETSKADGTCAPVQANTLHGNDCTASPKSGCGTTGLCDGKGDCLKWPAMTVCEAAFCSTDGQMATRASTCNGAGSCVGGGFQSCLTYACDTTKAACDTTCTKTDECNEGYYCDTTTSTCGKKPDGIVCAGGVECQSGNCGGRCCAPATTCTCPQPSPDNLIANAGFDTSITPAWTVNIVPQSKDTVTLAATDSASCPYSGAAEISYDNTDGMYYDPPSITQCVPVSQNTNYQLGMRGMSTCSAMWCTLSFFGTSDCTGTDLTIGSAMPETGGMPWSDWIDSGVIESPPAAETALVTCTTGYPIAQMTCASWIDSVYLSPSPHTY